MESGRAATVSTPLYDQTAAPSPRVTVRRYVTAPSTALQTNRGEPAGVSPAGPYAISRDGTSLARTTGAPPPCSPPRYAGTATKRIAAAAAAAATDPPTRE